MLTHLSVNNPQPDAVATQVVDQPLPVKKNPINWNKVVFITAVVLIVLSVAAFFTFFALGCRFQVSSGTAYTVCFSTIIAVPFLYVIARCARLGYCYFL